MKVPITVACGDYDRTRALFDGRVGIEGCQANLFALPVEETFFRALRNAEFDVAELSLSSYTMLRSRDACPYTAIPVFLSRMFRHSAIYVRTDSGIERPEDLRGRRVGVPEYQLTAPVWVRGLLEDDHAVAPSEILWHTGGVEQPGRHEKVDLPGLAGVRIEPIPEDETLNSWLLDGRIDALIAPRAPSAFAQGDARVRRLFGDDLRSVEQSYHARRRVFPIMHVVGVRNTLLATQPWIASSLLKAFTAAKDLALADLHEVAALKTSLPWLASEVADTVAALGPDFWPYGLRNNVATLETFLRYHHTQGLSHRRLAVEDLFAASTHAQYAI